MPFDVNVTTRDPGIAALLRTDEDDQEFGVRVVNTQAIPDGFGSTVGGIAFVGIFAFVIPEDFNDSPAFTFNKGENNGAITNSHEAGHVLGLTHHRIERRYSLWHW